MTYEEAHKIFEAWKEYIEIADKMDKIFSLVPESFLPYPVETLEEALNMVAESYFKNGDKRTANNIQETMAAHLTGYYLSSVEGKVIATDQKLTDEEVIRKMKRDLDFMLDHPDLLKAKLGNLEKARDSWAYLKEHGAIKPSTTENDAT